MMISKINKSNSHQILLSDFRNQKNYRVFVEIMFAQLIILIIKQIATSKRRKNNKSHLLFLDCSHKFAFAHQLVIIFLLIFPFVNEELFATQEMMELFLVMIILLPAVF